MGLSTDKALFFGDFEKPPSSESLFFITCLPLRPIGTLEVAMGAEITSDEHERSLVLAEAALTQIRALRLPLTPRNFEIFYAHATGHYPTLSWIIEDMLARRAHVSDSDIDKVGTRFISRSDLKDRASAIGACVKGEVSQVVSTIDSAIDLTTACSADLANVDAALSSVRRRDALPPVVEGMIRAANRIKEGQSKLVTQIDMSKSQLNQLRMETKEVVRASLNDPLTGLAYWKKIQRSAHETFSATIEGGKPFSMVFADLDHFASFNRTCGHLIGDRVLCLFANAINNNVRPADLVARYNGDKFVIAMPSIELEAAYAVADDLRRFVMSRNLTNRSTGQVLGTVTVSFGVASAQAHDTFDSLMARAKACNYSAKCNGRNRVIADTDQKPSEAIKIYHRYVTAGT